MMMLVMMLVLSVLVFPLDFIALEVPASFVVAGGTAGNIVFASNRSHLLRRCDTRARGKHRLVGNPAATLSFVLVLQSLPFYALSIHPALSLDDPSVCSRYVVFCRGVTRLRSTLSVFLFSLLQFVVVHVRGGYESRIKRSDPVAVVVAFC